MKQTEANGVSPHLVGVLAFLSLGYDTRHPQLKRFHLPHGFRGFSLWLAPMQKHHGTKVWWSKNVQFLAARK